MDALSAGSGAVAFITLAFQSTKALAEIISSVRDGPKHVRDLSHDVERLQHILARLSRCQAIAHEDPSIAVFTRRCSEDVSLYACRLQKMHILPTERRTGRLWKKLKAVMSEKDIQIMKLSIHGHVSSLSLQLNLLQTDMIWDSRQYLEDLASTVVQPIRQEPDNVLTENSKTSTKFSCRCVLPIAEEEPHTHSRLAKSPKANFLDSFIRLPQLAGTEVRTVLSGEARVIISGLEDLLCAALSDISGQKPQDNPSPLPGCGKYSHARRPHNDVELELRLIRSLISSARQISINALCRSKSARRPGVIVQQQRKRKRITIDKGLLMVNSVKQRQLIGPETSSCAHFEAAGQEFLGTVTFFPTKPLSSLVIIASVHQEELRGGTYSETPRLCVDRLLPSDAPVFKIVQDGLVEELQALISQGKARLRDRDANGLSLLHYAVCQPAMCRFLIDSGADVNEIAGKNDQAESLPLLAVTTRATTSDRGSGEFEAAKECIQILLAADADPTISLKSWDSPFHIACNPKDIDILEIFLSLGSRFAHVELADSRGQTPLLRMCSWYSTYTRQAFTYLVNRDANIDARDNTGAACLHIAIENAKRPLSGELEALAYLVDQGADVYATTTEGVSVSEVAYTTSSTDVVYRLGSYRGDLWDAVLALGGYDVACFRRSWPREEKFTAQYTRANFEELWRGREHLCPYFDSVVLGEETSSKTSDGVTTEDTSPVAKRRSFEASIRQRTDISVTIDSMDSLRLNKGNEERYEQYEGTCVSSRSLGEVPPVPLLWDPSLVHHLMPNPWHDIIPQVSESARVESQINGRTTASGSITDRAVNADDWDLLPKRESDEHNRPFYGGMEMENVWNN